MALSTRVSTPDIDLTLFSDDEAFQAWMAWMIQTKRLDGALEILVQNESAPAVTSLEQGIQYLADVSRSNPFDPETARLAVSDFSGSSHTRPFLQLSRALNVQSKDPPSVLLWNIGRLTHEVVGGLWSGAYPQRERPPVSEHPAQLDLLIKLEPQQLPLFGSVRAGNKTSNLLVELADCWQELAAKLKYPHWWENYTAISYPEIQRLHGLLKAVFGPALEPLGEYECGDTFARHAAFLAKMQWATAAVHAGQIGRQGIFRERLILPESYRLGSWRIDILVVESVDRSPLTEKHYAIIERMARKKYASVADIYADLQAQLGAGVTVRIHELKSSLGDNTPNPNQRIDPQDLAGGPLESHLIKVKTYVTLAELHQNLTAGNPLWGSGTFSDAHITYFSPETPPLTYRFHMTPEEQQQVFEEQIAVSFPGAIRAAAIRDRSNLLIGHIAGLIDRKPRMRARTGRGLAESPGDTPLFPEMHPSRRIRGVIEGLRRFLDPETRVIEVMPDRRKRCSDYVMHVDALLQGIEDKRIVADHFGEDGGNICCLMPGHDDHHPSMRIYLRRGYARCFVCNAYIPFVHGSVPAYIRIEPRTRIRKRHAHAAINTVDYAFEDFEVPEIHFRTMGIVQSILQGSFQKSRGEQYLLHRRRIDPDLAYANGAGFCTDSAVHRLLDALDFDECVYYGLIGFSSVLNSSQGLAPLLKRRGMTSEQFVRRKRSRGKEMLCLPYFILKNRVTFPLSFAPGRITNFYGRAVWENCPKEWRHRKLLIEHTGVPHGIFNPEALEKSSSFVPVCEGIMDALALKHLGYDAVALIGVANLIAFETLRRYGRHYGIALDNDTAGSDATQGMITWFRERDYSHTIFNFTQRFLIECPEAITYDDFGSWWEQSGYENLRSSEQTLPSMTLEPLCVRA